MKYFKVDVTDRQRVIKFSYVLLAANRDHAIEILDEAYPDSHDTFYSLEELEV